jgi:hypothetical protein
MKALKNILVSALLSIVMLCYFAHDVVEYYGHIINKIENTQNTAGSQRIVTSEPSMEEEISFVSSGNSFKSVNSGNEKIVVLTKFYPTKLAYPVWLPPENS